MKLLTVSVPHAGKWDLARAVEYLNETVGIEPVAVGYTALTRPVNLPSDFVAGQSRYTWLDITLAEDEAEEYSAFFNRSVEDLEDDFHGEWREVH